MKEQNKSKVNLQSINDGFSGITTANSNNSGKSTERGFSGVVSANSNSGSKNSSSNSGQSTKTK